MNACIPELNNVPMCHLTDEPDECEFLRDTPCRYYRDGFCLSLSAIENALGQESFYRKRERISNDIQR